MCYSAQVKADWKRFTRFGAKISLHEFYELFWRQLGEPEARIKVPKALELMFSAPQSDEERRIKELIDRRTAAEVTRVEQELFKQRTRLVTAERTLAGAKPTKKAADDQRIATSKIAKAMRDLADLRRTELQPQDERIYPGVWAPVMAVEDGELVVLPMRYQCRPHGKPALYDAKYPGTYNARRDNLEGPMWRDVFGYRHGILIASAFFEHVPQHKREGRELAPGEQPVDTILEFKPEGLDEMLVACIWSRWRAPGQPDLLSFAAITDEPPPEVAAAGHDRCIIPIKPEHLDAWLRPRASELSAQYAILDDRERPYYEHRLAA